MKIKLAYFSILVLFLNACFNKSDNSGSTTMEVDSTRLEAIEDSIEYIASLELQAKIPNILTVDQETEPVESLDGEDAADDPAIWINKKDPSKSLVLGTNKRAGLYVYNLEGKMIQYKKIGRINNVDLREDFTYQGKKVVLVAGSNRSINAISLLYIDPATGEMSDTIANIFSGVDEVYGVCLYKNPKENNFYVYVNGKGGMVEQWSVQGEDEISAEMVRSFNASSQPEGMVANDAKQIVYFGVEDEGIFKIPADPSSSADFVKIPGSDSTNLNIVYDIEGLALFQYNKEDYLLASSQGNFSYAIFHLGDDEKYITSFILKEDSIDGVEETDGLEVAVYPFNNHYPLGLIVVQDGFNYEGDSLVNQNFKYVSFEKIVELLK